MEKLWNQRFDTWVAEKAPNRVSATQKPMTQRRRRTITWARDASIPGTLASRLLACQIIAIPSNSGNGREPLGRDLVFTAKALREAFEDVMEGAGGSLGTWIVLNAISDEGIVSHSILASRAHVDGATITYHVDRAEKLGLVQREVDPADRRVKTLRLTPEGERLYKTLWSVARSFERQVMAGITDADQTRLRRVLAKLRANLAAPSGEEPARRRGRAAPPRE
jgi:MarR family transcriptional regulator, transcriptional regulator for hemolysin